MPLSIAHISFETYLDMRACSPCTGNEAGSLAGSTKTKISTEQALKTASDNAAQSLKHGRCEEAMLFFTSSAQFGFFVISSNRVDIAIFNLVYTVAIPAAHTDFRGTAPLPAAARSAINRQRRPSRRLASSSSLSSSSSSTSPSPWTPGCDPRQGKRPWTRFFSSIRRGTWNFVTYLVLALGLGFPSLHGARAASVLASRG